MSECAVPGTSTCTAVLAFASRITISNYPHTNNIVHVHNNGNDRAMMGHFEFCSHTTTTRAEEEVKKEERRRRSRKRKRPKQICAEKRKKNFLSFL